MGNAVRRLTGLSPTVLRRRSQPPAPLRNGGQGGHHTKCKSAILSTFSVRMCE
jgi:hypothetical protein